MTKQTVIYNFRKCFKLNIILSFGLIFLMTSCFYSGKYFASYTVQNKQTDKNAKVISIDFLNQLADKNSLTKDSKFDGIDTLGFYGQPYHYFKFWFEQIDSNTIVKLDYYGVYGSRKNQPYRDLFSELNDFMKTNFIIIEQDIKEENNAKKKEK
ncbi:hypothetical protein [Williamwhitmania taraxaci]|nr:hypothetical protein [Williamwhitmania taraxaci]